jgi:hypothetical protein
MSVKEVNRSFIEKTVRRWDARLKDVVSCTDGAGVNNLMTSSSGCK